MDTPELTVADLHALGIDEQLAAVVTGVSEGRNVAVVAEPFAGRSAVLDVVEAFVPDAQRRPATEYGPGREVDVRLVDDCQRLYSREIDGFERLDAFLDAMVASDDVFVTSWNEYAWRYLSATTGVADSFGVQVTVPPVGSDVLSSWLRDLADETLEYVDDSESIPARFDASAITSLRTLREQLGLLLFLDADDVDPCEAVFGAIARISGGNPGVAKRLWAAVLEAGEATDVVRTSTVADAAVDLPSLEYDEVFALQLLVSNEGIARVDLEGLVGAELSRSVRRLADLDVVLERDGEIRIAPAALKAVVERLETRRMVW